MRPRSPRYGRAAVVAACAAVISVAVAWAPAYARDSGGADSDWEPLDRVLVIPPVYKPAAKAKAPATADLPGGPAGCAAPPLDSGADGSIAVAGTADSTGTADSGCAPTGSGDAQAQDSPSERSAAPDSAQPAQADDSGQPQASGGAQEDAATVDSAIGSINDYQQQEAAAEAAAAPGIGQVPIVVGPPPVPYYLPRTYAAPAPAMNHVYVPAPAFPRTPLASWMPRAPTPMVMAPPAWMPQPAVPMTAAPAPMFIPRAFGGGGGASGFGASGGWRR